MLNDKTILLTGGTGSFGTKFTKTILDRYDPAALRIFSRGEHNQADMREDFDDHPDLRFLIGDVRNKNRLSRAMEGVDVVVHAAALKRVPTCEYNPLEAKRTNVDGTANLIDAAIDKEVNRVIGLSTDKAVHPINLYGATKLVGEKLLVQGNSYTGGRETRFGVVRYGNVVGSKGSVVPTFIEQRKEGTLTITHEDMTRFWITLEKGVELVLNALERLRGGEIYVPKIPSMKVVDLAKAIAPEADHEVIGIRPGEKLAEILVTEEEARHAREFDDHYLIEPEHPFWNRTPQAGGTELPEGFEYRSDENDEWLETKELRAMVRELGYEL